MMFQPADPPAAASEPAGPRLRRRSVLAGLILAAAADPGVSRGDIPAAVAVADVPTGDTVRLADGREVRLAAVEAPWPAVPGRHAAWPLADAARDALAALLAGRAVAVAGVTVGDRYGGWRGLLVRNDGTGVQEALLDQGWVRVRFRPDDPGDAPALLAREATARRDGVGLWSHPAYRPRLPEEVAADVGDFQLVTGTVRRVARSRSVVYINFGELYRSDFTAELASRDLRRFQATGHDIFGLEGSRVLVRGVVEDRNGPAIRMVHPSQLVPEPV